MNDFLKWLFFIGGGFLTFFEPIAALTFAVLLLFFIDLITGVSSAVKMGEKIKSYKMRRSAYKLFTYLGTMALTFAVCELMGLTKETATTVVKIEAWFVVYIEGLSITENLRKISDNVYLQYLHYLLSVEFLKKFTVLSDFAKQKNNEAED